MVKDRIGNELHEGDLVEIKLVSNDVMAFVTEVQRGGVITGVRKGGREATPGLVTLAATFHFEFDPGDPALRNMVRLVNPGAPPAPIMASESDPVN
jgi:hypothetical protein